MRFGLFRNFDRVLFFLMLGLIIIGLAVQYSLSLAVKLSTGTSEPGLNNFTKQCIFVGIGLILFFAISLIDFRFIKVSAYWVYILTILLLIGVLLFGQTLRGVKGWLNLGFFSLQPTEIAKLVAIIVLARFWQEVRQPVRVHNLLVSFLLIAPLFLLIVRQPDLGSAIIILLLWLSIIFLADKNKKHVIGLLIFIILISVLAWSFFFKDYQRERILTYLNLSSDPLGRGYQITQSVIAVGSGQFFGRGFGFSPQSQLRFLPASETDFVFASFAEQFGLFGCLILLGLNLFLLYRLIRISQTAYDNFSLVSVLGVGLYLFFQLMINVGMNMGLMPVIGIPLPFISYGGSSLLVSMIALGLVESIIVHQPFAKKRGDGIIEIGN